MKKNTLFRLQTVVAFCLFLVISTNAQPTFIKSIGGMFDEYGFRVLQKENGDFIISGFTTTNSEGQEDFYLIKTDVNGNPAWEKSYGEPLTDISYSVIETFDGGYLMCGDSQTYGTGIFSASLIKTDGDGNFQWQKKYYGDYSAMGRDVVQADENSYVFCASTRNETDAPSNTLLVKINLEGDTIWTKKFGGPDDDWPRTLVKSNDGGFVICGGSRNTGNGIEDVYIIKTDEDGNLIWEGTYGSHTYDSGNTIIETNDGGYVVCGQSTNSSAGYLDFILLRIDAYGNEIWQKYFGNDDAAWGMSITASTDGGFVACGGLRKGLNETIFAWLVKVDQNGDEVWTQQFNFEENKTTYAASIITAQNGGYAVCGYTKADGNLEWMDLLLIKTDDMGIVTLIETIETQPPQLLKISPNPSNGKFCVEIPKGATDIKIFDSNGALLVEETLMENPEKSIRNFDLSNFGKGMYFVNAYTEGKTFNGKVVVE